MSSLRARLLAAVLVVAAVGLLLLAAITYFEQRSFQLSRIDDTARGGASAVLGALAQQGIGEHSEPDRDSHRGGPPRGGGPGVGLPAGTYGQLRDASGVHPVVFDYGQNVESRPKIPASVPIDRPRTVSGAGGDDTSYRVVATRLPHQSGVVVVAVPLREVDQSSTAWYSWRRS
jgi:two-component system OmpR family sensor kinase